MIRVKPFKLEFIYATALRGARANSAALFVPRGRTILNLHSRFEFILSILLRDQTVRDVALKSLIYLRHYGMLTLFLFHPSCSYNHFMVEKNFFKAILFR